MPLFAEPKTPADHELYNYLTGMRELRERMGKPSIFLYSGVEEFLLKHGTFFQPSVLPATLRPMALQQCFENAFRVAKRTKGFHYVEGMAISVIPVNHAWLIDRDGFALDLTWAKQRVPHGSTYIGVELNLDEVQLSRRGGCLSLLDDWKRDFPALQGVESVFAKDAWFRR